MFVKLSCRTEESNLRPAARLNAGQRRTQLHYVTQITKNITPRIMQLKFILTKLTIIYNIIYNKQNFQKILFSVC
jgi:hypothetical protein